MGKGSGVGRSFGAAGRKPVWLGVSRGPGQCIQWTINLEKTVPNKSVPCYSVRET